MGFRYTFLRQRPRLGSLINYGFFMPCHLSRWAVLIGLLLTGIIPTEAQIYYIENDNSATLRGDQLWRINVDGTNQVQVATNFANVPGVLAIDRASNKAYVAEARGTTATHKVISVDLTSGVSQTITTGIAGSICRGIAVDPRNQYIYYTLDNQSATSTDDQLRRVSYNPTGTVGSNDVLVLTNFVNVAGPINIDLTNNRLFAIDARATAPKIIAINLSNNTATTILTSVSVVTGISYDSRVNKLYYTISDGQAATSIDQLRRMNPDGTGDEVVLGNFSANVPGNIALDKANNLMIVADVRGTAPEILKVTLTSLTATTVTTLPNNFALVGVAVYPTCATFVTTLTPSPSSAISCTQTSLTLTATGGVSYTFARSGGGGITSQSSSGSAIINASGTYSVTVTDAEGCAMVSTTIISQNTAPPSVTITTPSNTTTLDCNVTAITLTASGGVAYRWDNGVTTATRNVITANTYSVTVTGTNGCTTVATKTISQNITPPPVSLTATNVCAGQSVTLTATVGIGSYTFVGGSGVIGSGANTTTVSGLSPGPYSFTVLVRSSVNSCTNTAVASASVTALPTPTLTVNPNSTLTCAQTSLTLTATGGNSYIFARAGGGGVVSQNASAGTAVINASGTYSVTVASAGGCSSVTTTIVDSNTAPPSLTITPGSGTLTCATTSITLTASGTGTGYIWSDNTTGPTLVVSVSGTYSVTATGTNSCTAQTSATINSNTVVTPVLSANFGGTLTCARTSLTLTATGGNSFAFAGPGIVSQNTSSGTAIVNADGLYSVTVTNTSTGCSSTTTTSISSNTTTPTANLSSSFGAVASSTLTCTQTSLTFTATGGNSYTFAGPGLVSQNATAGTAVVNATGTYSVTITGANGCTALASTTVSQSITPPVADLQASTTLTCSQTSVTLTATGGVSYTFAGPGVVSQNAAAGTAVVNASGTYSVTVADGTGCKSVTTTIVESNTAPPGSASLTASNSGTLTCSITTLTLTASATGTGLTYAFSGPGGAIAGNGTSRTINASGTYSVTITGGNGCTALASTTVSSNTTLPTATLSANFSGSLTCSQTSLTLTAMGGNTYAFAGPGLVSQNAMAGTAVINATGTYSVTVTNTTTGCFSTTTLVIGFVNTGSLVVNMMASNTALSCSSPTALLTATPGFGGYQFAGPGLNQTGTSNTAPVSTSGIFTVTATSGACSATASVTVVGVPGTPPNALLFGNGTLSCQTPTVSLTALGGSSYSFSGPGIVSQTDGRESIIIGSYIINRRPIPTIGQAVVNKPGTYTVLVTGENGCSVTVTIVVTGVACP